MAVSGLPVGAPFGVMFVLCSGDISMVTIRFLTVFLGFSEVLLALVMMLMLDLPVVHGLFMELF